MLCKTLCNSYMLQVELTLMLSDSFGVHHGSELHLYAETQFLHITGNKTVDAGAARPFPPNRQPTPCGSWIAEIGSLKSSSSALKSSDPAGESVLPSSRVAGRCDSEKKKIALLRPKLLSPTTNPQKSIKYTSSKRHHGATWEYTRK